MRLPLHLVHVVDLGPDELYETPRNVLVSVAEVHLQHQAERLRRAGVQVEVHIKGGAPGEALRAMAEELEAQLIVVGALGQRRDDGWQIGSHADRTAQRSHVPVLVVRNSAPFEAWAAGGRALRIVLGVDASLSSGVAGRWISDLSKFGPCEIVLAHLCWPAAEFQRLGLGGARSWVDPDVEITKALEQEYSERFAPLFAAANVTCRLEPHLGRLGDALASLATEENAALVVVGCHNRGALARIWEGSVSQRTLRCARTSVACIPAPRHVENQAAKLVPKGGADVRASTQIHILEASDTKAAICQGAERLGADLICLGTHGRSGVSRALLGSVAAAVLAGARRPVLLARAPLE